MNESILVSIKKLLGITEDHTHFDADIIMHINSVFFVLWQLGVGPSTPFMIEDDSATWDEFVSNANFELVKSYMYLKVRLMFDPPLSSTVVDSMKRMIDEYEWRLNDAAESNGEEVIQNG